MSEIEFLELLAKILDRPIGAFGPAVTLDSVGWDSLAVLSLLSELDENFQIELDSEKLSGAKTVSDLADLLLISS
jgi:acyl carrier protein